MIQHFKNNCFVIANGDTLQFSNIQVQLGHETNLFAELENVPKSMQSLYVSNTVFKDMPNNKCELIVTLNGLPQKQYVLDNSNQQAVMLKAENAQWVVVEAADAINVNNTYFFILVSMLFILLVVYAFIKRKLIHQYFIGTKLSGSILREI